MRRKKKMIIVKWKIINFVNENTERKKVTTDGGKRGLQMHDPCGGAKVPFERHSLERSPVTCKRVQRRHRRRTDEVRNIDTERHRSNHLKYKSIYRQAVRQYLP